MRRLAAVLFLLPPFLLKAQRPPEPVRVGTFLSEVATIEMGVPAPAGRPGLPADPRLRKLPLDMEIRQVAIAPSKDGRIAVAASSGLLLASASADWRELDPADARGRSWRPRDVRGVAFDSAGNLWFASPQGIGRLDAATSHWTLYDPAEIPHDDFTTVAAGAPDNIWFGTKLGAIHFDGQHWAYRQGRRWLADDEVVRIQIEPNGAARIQTRTGLSTIERKPMTLAEKARFFEEEIDKRHRRTEYGYVLGVTLKNADDKSQFTQSDSDNDGLWTAMYGAGQCFAFAATGDEKARQRAHAAFRALRFLGTVTQGGDHPAPKGYVARTVLPASAGNPNDSHYTPERDKQFRDTRDSLWKVMSPRWPKSADGKWYWKADTSSDELDGHFFFYSLYYDLVARTDEEKREVREHVDALAGHLVDHNFQLVDHDGLVTRWGVFNPEKLNHDRNWYEERGLNSLSILAYLKVAVHITGNARFETAARTLIEKHSYAQNALIPKTHMGPGSGNQSDDEMLFMNLYHLIQYEQDTELRRKYLESFHNHWELEQPERNPLFNFLYASLATGQIIPGTHRPTDTTPPAGWLEDSIDTLKRIPLDRRNWALRNSHRKDIRLLEPNARGTNRGFLSASGKVLPADERFVEHWNHDPWTLDTNGDGRRLADGNAFLLPYYLGLYLKYIE